MTTTLLHAGRFAALIACSDGTTTLYVVKEHDYAVSEVFEDVQQALKYFEHTERYEAAQERKGRR